MSPAMAGRKATIALAMIVRNEEANLPRCLGSLRGFFDELCIVDTGSTDGTVKVARRFGAVVHRFAWCDDFAAARNFGIDRTTCDYVFRFDADESLPKSQHKRFSRLLGHLNVTAPRVFTCRVHAMEHTGTVVVTDEVRIWPSLPAIRFRGSIHERVHPEHQAPGIPVIPSGVRIDHHGYEDAATYRRKLRRNLEILESEALKGYRHNPLVHFDLGRTLSALGAKRAALRSFADFLATMNRDHTLAGRVAHRQVVEIHRDLGDLAEAMAAARRGLEAYPDDPVLVSNVADMMRHVGEMELAREGYRRCLDLYDPGRMDSGIPADFRTRVEMALAECL